MFFRKKKLSQEQIKSGEFCECGICGHRGYVYGVAGSEGISAPFCQVCGINGKLKKVPIDACGCKSCQLKTKCGI